MCPGILARLTTVAVAASAVAAGCSQQPTSAAIRSLEQSGRTSFVCLQSDGTSPAAPLDACAPNSPDRASKTLLALVTQTTRGEVAVIDLDSSTVVDLNPSQPTYNFIPVGALPTDIATTPGGTVTFVGAREPNKYAIYVLPSDTLLRSAPHLTSLAACALPTPPGRMTVLARPPTTVGVDTPSRCDGQVDEPAAHPYGDLSTETSPPGPRKLLVTLPDQGDIAILDAQQLLDLPPGGLAACPIERLVHLSVDLPATKPLQRTPMGGWPPGISESGKVCELTTRAPVENAYAFSPHPTSLSFDPETGLAYIADDVAPVIHALDLRDPCSPVERPPLLPTSFVNPSRNVLTREAAVTGTTSQGRKYVYAIDHPEGSIMVFDVSVGSTDRTPLLHSYPDRRPFQSPDRISFDAPVRTLTFMLRDAPAVDSVSGVAATGTHCDPNSASVGLGASYRTTTDFAGAGPKTLRGWFGAAALSNGDVVFIDVDDFDAECRRFTESNSCPDETLPNYAKANGELSCNVVEPHQPRSSAFMLTGASQAPGARVPGLQSFPTLGLSGAILNFDEEHPKLLAPAPKEGQNQIIQVSGNPLTTIDTNPLDATHNVLWFDFREPRAHRDQDWQVTFEGMIPGFSGHVLRLRPSNDKGILEDAGANFCDRGVHDLDAVIQTLNPGDSALDPASPAYVSAQSHMDVVQITAGFPDKDDPYWGSVAAQCSHQLCLESFGPADAPKPTREFPILEAYQGHVVVDDSLQFAQCCFPTLVSYTVRARQQWVVVGAAAGFLHKGTVDPDTHRCIDSCDPVLRYLNGRVLEVPFIDKETPNPQSLIPVTDSPQVFRNPIMQFWIAQGSGPSVQDMTFTFTSTGGFLPLNVNLAASTPYVMPLSITYLPQLGQLALSDGSVQGLIMIDVGSVSLLHTIY